MVRSIGATGCCDFVHGSLNRGYWVLGLRPWFAQSGLLGVGTSLMVRSMGYWVLGLRPWFAQSGILGVGTSSLIRSIGSTGCWDFVNGSLNGLLGVGTSSMIRSIGATGCWDFVHDSLNRDYWVLGLRPWFAQSGLQGVGTSSMIRSIGATGCWYFVHDSLNRGRWVLGLRPWFSVLKNTTIQKLGLFLCPGEERKKSRYGEPNSIRGTLCKIQEHIQQRPQRSMHRNEPEDGNRYSLRNVAFSRF
jgi:hypothetical protein